MKASLRGKDGDIIDLSGVETTFGREDSDIILRFPNVEVKHAIIQFNEEEQCYILQDLNTSHGCYVNETRVQNAAVRLAHGDLIGFGYGNPMFEFQLSVDPVGPVYSLPLQTSGHNSLRYFTSTAGVRGNSFLPYLPISTAFEEQQLPLLSGSNSLPANSSTTLDNPSMWAAKPLMSTTIPRPPVRTRPSSAGVQRARPISANSKTSATSSFSRGSWTSTPKQQDQRTNTIEELEERLLRMGDELSRLACYETECHRKDHVISELRDEIAELKRYQPDTSTGPSSFTNKYVNLKGEISELHNNLRVKQEADRTTSQKLAAFQSQLHQKNKEIASLKQRLDDLTLTQSRSDGWMDKPDYDKDISTNTIASLRTELANKDKNIAQLKNELEKTTKQRSHITSLMNTLQKENSSKETLLQHAKSDFDKLKKTLREKEAMLANVSAKLTRQKAAMEVELEVEKTREELLAVKTKFQSCQKQLREKNSVVSELQNEIEKCRKDVEQALKGDKVSKMELDHAKAQFVDVQRELQLGKVELKQLEKRFDQFSKRVIEATFKNGFCKVSRKELDDDEIVDYVKQLSDERKQLSKQLDDISDFEERNNSDAHSLKLAQEEFEHCLKQIRTTLSWSGRHLSTLRTSVEKLTEYEVDQEQLEWAKTVCLHFLKDELAWHEKEEHLLLDAGLDQDTISEGIPKIITQLQKDIQSREIECKRLQEKVCSMEEVHETTISRLKEELSSRESEIISTVVRETRAEESEKRLEMIRNFKEKENERIEVAIATERRILESQHGGLEQMKKVLDEKNEECENYKVTLTSARTQHEEAKEIIQKHEAAENLLRQELEKKCSLHDEQMKESEKQLVDYQTSKDNELASYKEQAHQHALTIVALEERLIRLSKQSKFLEEEQLARQQLASVSPKRSRPLSPKKSSSRPSSPTKARPVSAVKEEKSSRAASVFTQTISRNNSEDILKNEIFKLEQLVLLLRQEAAQAKRESAEHSEVVVGLKRDLAGAWARLSDVTGELSDQQKQKVEEYKEKIDIQDRELHDQRQQLKQLSALVDIQKLEIERSRRESGDQKERNSNGKVKTTESEKQRRKKIEKEVEESKQLVVANEETSNDIRKIAERCHGDKHAQVITKQKEALREMRQRLKKLEQFKPPFPSHEQALQQVTFLKNEMSELRATEAGREEDFNRSATELQHEVKKNRQLLCQNATDMAIEKSGHEETKIALDKSEQTYLELVRSVAKLLSVDSLPGCRSMAHLPSQEREVLEQERHKSLEMIQERIHNLTKHLNSKKELLKDYNKDLEKLKEVEMMAGRKSAEVESLVTDLENQNREASCLRVSLDRTRDELDQQRRLNTSLKERKKFSIDTKEEEPKKHSCYVDEQKRYKEELKRKKMAEKIKKKNFEIESLKQELRSADAELNNTAAELQALDPSRNFSTSYKTDSMSPPEHDSQHRYVTIF